MPNYPSVQFNRPNLEQAEALHQSALTLFEEQQFREALELLERAIGLDQIGALNQYLSLRAECARRIERPSPQLALDWYNHAKSLTAEGRFHDAQVAYQEAMTLDSSFLWPGNNLAWMLSTSTERTVRDGHEAVRVAEEVCQRSNWSCWAFLGTLAAAYAEAGRFPKEKKGTEVRRWAARAAARPPR